MILLEVAAMVGHTPQLTLRPYANGRVVPPPPPPPSGLLPNSGLCWQSQRSLKKGKYLGRIFLPKTTAKGAGTALCHACMEEGEGGGGGGGGTV